MQSSVSCMRGASCSGSAYVSLIVRPGLWPAMTARPSFSMCLTFRMFVVGIRGEPSAERTYTSILMPPFVCADRLDQYKKL